MTPAGDDASLGEFTPAFLWLLRDFYLKLEEEGHKVGLGPLLVLLLDSAVVKAASQRRPSGGHTTFSQPLLLLSHCRANSSDLQISAKDYLETALHPVDGDGPSVKAKNDIRASIK